MIMHMEKETLRDNENGEEKETNEFSLLLKTEKNTNCFVK